tara:strand:+ start:91 stop:414 length:324 start_codon:yes stop_codon:yes gene_type:complete
MSYKANILTSMGIYNYTIDENDVVIFSDPELTEEQKTTLENRFKAEKDILALRAKRNVRLANCDWTQGADVPDKIKIPWAAYRKELRDLPANTADPANPTWPKKPTI